MPTEPSQTNCILREREYHQHAESPVEAEQFEGE